MVNTSKLLRRRWPVRSHGIADAGDDDEHAEGARSPRPSPATSTRVQRRFEPDEAWRRTHDHDSGDARDGRVGRPAGHPGGDDRARPGRQRRRRRARRRARRSPSAGRTSTASAATCSPSSTTTARSMPCSPSGRAGSGADAGALRAEGLTEMPLRHDIRTVTVPGCVDGWLALHERFGTLAGRRAARAGDRPGGTRLPGEPAARRLAGAGRRARRWPTSSSSRRRPAAGRAGAPPRCRRGARCARRHGSRRLLRRTRSARACSPSAAAGSRADDLTTSLAEWVTPLRAARLGRRPVDDPAELAGLPGDRRRRAGRRARPARRPRRRPLGAPAGRGGDRRRPRPRRAAPRRRRRRCAGARVRRPRRAGRPGAGVAARRAAARRATPRTCAPSTRSCARVAHPVERLGLRLVAGRAEHRDQPAQPRPRLQPRGRATPPSSRPGRRPPHTLLPAMATRRRTAATPCSARWAATPSRRSCCSSRPGCSATASRPADGDAAPGAGRCAGRSPGSTRGPRRAGRWCRSRATRRRSGPTAWPRRGHPVHRAAGVRQRLRARSRDPSRASTACSPAPPTRARWVGAVAGTMNSAQRHRPRAERPRCTVAP